jgi:3-phosphoshikimate 1-carboxyvinyltransferase
LQGDRAIADIMKSLGVASQMEGAFLRLTQTPAAKELTCDFTHCPDLAQTVAVVCAAKGVNGVFTGLESLRIKETDRIAALQNELAKIGARLEENNSSWRLIPSTSIPRSATFLSYKDHRMAMAFAPLATLMDVTIENPAVVRKSYPTFWDDLKGIGFTVGRSEES